MGAKGKVTSLLQKRDKVLASAIQSAVARVSGWGMHAWNRGGKWPDCGVRLSCLDAGSAAGCPIGPQEGLRTRGEAVWCVDGKTFGCEEARQPAFEEGEQAFRGECYSQGQGREASGRRHEGKGWGGCWPIWQGEGGR